MIIKRDQIFDWVRYFPHLGGGSYSNVYDCGDFVVKLGHYVPDDVDDDGIKAQRYRRREAANIVRRMKELREKMGDIIPRTWYGFGGLVLQEKSPGIYWHNLKMPARDVADKNIDTLYDKFKEIYPDVFCDTHTGNMTFHEDGSLMHWFDPIIPMVKTDFILFDP